MKKLTKLAIIVILLLGVLIFMSQSGMLSTRRLNQQALICDQIPSGYAQLLSEQIPSLQISQDPRKFLQHVKSGQESYVLVEDARIESRLDAGLPGYFTPHYLSTIVMVIPLNSQVDIQSITDLKNSGANLFFPDTHKTRILPAMALALGETDRLNAAAALLSELKQQDRLIIGLNSDDYISRINDNTIALMPDDEAARLILSGLPLRMVVPIDGTLSYVVGLYSPSSRVPPILINPDDLVEAGFRTLDGNANVALYPSPGQYDAAQRATTMENYPLLAHDAVKVFRRRILGTHLLIPADGSDRVLLNIPLALLVVFWGVSLFWRVVDHRVRRLLQIQTALLLLWLLNLVLKQSSDLMTTRYLWYLYYLPLLGSCLILALISLYIAGAPEQDRRRLQLVFILPSALFITLVLSNDLHQGVFFFPAGLPQYDPYTHVAGFYLMAFWMAFLLFSGFLRLYRNAGIRKKGQYIVLLSLLIGLVIGYNALYVAGVQGIRQTQTGTFHIIFILLFWELTLRSGLIPYNRYYRMLFQFSRLPLFLIGNDGAVSLTTTGAESLPLEIDAGIRKGDRLFYSPGDDERSLGPDYEAAKISEGFVVWKNDLDEIRRLHQSLQVIRQRLANQAELLKQQVEQENMHQELLARRQLLEQLEQLIRPRLNEVSIRASRLSTALAKKDLVAELQDIISIVGYCKRVGLIHINAIADGRVPSKVLTLALQEICSDHASDGLSTGFFGELNDWLRLTDALLCLDFVSECFSLLRDSPEGTIVLHAQDQDIYQNLICLCDLPPDYIEKMINHAEIWQSKLNLPGLSLEIIPEDPSLRLILRLERGVA